MQQMQHHETKNKEMASGRGYFHNRKLDYVGMRERIVESILPHSTLVDVGGGSVNTLQPQEAEQKDIRTLKVDFDRTLQCNSAYVDQIICDLHAQCFDIFNGHNLDQLLDSLSSAPGFRGRGARTIQDALQSHPVRGVLFSRICKYLRPLRASQLIIAALRSLPHRGVTWIIGESKYIEESEKHVEELPPRTQGFDTAYDVARATSYPSFDIQEFNIIPWVTEEERAEFFRRIKRYKQMQSGTTPADWYKEQYDKPERMELVTDLSAFAGRDFVTSKYPDNNIFKKNGRLYIYSSAERIMRIKRER